MLRTFSTACATVAMAAFAFNTTDAHGYISVPAYKAKIVSATTNYNMRITANVNSAFAGLKWNDSPKNNVATFTKAFPNTGYKSLKDMIDQQIPDCANSLMERPPVDVFHQSVMTWQNDQAQVGLIDSHRGPCEVYINNILMVHQDDCVAAYGSGFPARLLVDFSKCIGMCTLTFYWLPVHELEWQIYKQCVPIVNNSRKQMAGTVKPAGASSYGRQNRALRTIQDAQASGQWYQGQNRADSRL